MKKILKKSTLNILANRFSIIIGLLTFNSYLMAVPAPLDLHIVLDGISSRKYFKMYKKYWPKACQNLQESFTNSNRVLQHGVFTSIDCASPVKKMKFKKYAKKLSNVWILKITDKRKSTKAEIFFKTKDKMILEGSYTLFFDEELMKRYLPQLKKLKIKKMSGRISLVQAITDSKVAALLSQVLMDQMPMSSIFEFRDLTEKMKFKKSDKHLQLPKKYVLFDLSFDPVNYHWIPKIIGYAKRKKKKKKTEWKLNVHYGTYIKGKTYFAQDQRGRSFNQKKIGKNLLKEIKIFGYSEPPPEKPLLFKISSLSGLRLGYPLTSGDHVMNATPIASVFSEFSQGIMKGVSIHGYYVPFQIKAVNENIKQEFGQSKFSIGRSFDWSIENKFGGFFSNIAFTPKIGLASLKITIPYLEDDTYVNSSFEIANIPVAGIAAALVKKYPTILLKGWIEYNYGSGDSTDQTSVHAGSDFYWRLSPQKQKVSYNFLLFSIYDSVNLSKNNEVEQSNEGEEAGIKKLKFNLFYVGLGAAISW
ncbi:MAG: hypothetical protein CMP10_18850 [Zetaproteobacteria bacterium]|nr:hypothetical protein [Pseudobdellovibrionaceae bacterium]